MTSEKVSDHPRHDKKPAQQSLRFLQYKLPRDTDALTQHKRDFGPPLYKFSKPLWVLRPVPGSGLAAPDGVAIVEAPEEPCGYYLRKVCGNIAGVNSYTKSRVTRNDDPDGQTFRVEATVESFDEDHEDVTVPVTVT